MTLRLPPASHSLPPAPPPRAARLVAFLADAAARLDGMAAAAWRASIEDLYGDLSGQRGLDKDPAVRRLLAGRRRVALPDLIVALQTYYALLCDALAVGAGELAGLPPGR